MFLHPKPCHEDTKWTAPNIYPACEIEEWSSKQIKILLTETSFPFLLATKTLYCMMTFSIGYRNLFTLVYDFSSYRSQLMFEDPDSYLVFFTSSPLSRSLYLTCACPTLVFSLLYLSTSTWTFLQSPGHKDNYLCVNLPDQSNQQACLHTWTRITWPPPPPHGHTSLHRGSPEMFSAQYTPYARHQHHLPEPGAPLLNHFRQTTYSGKHCHCASLDSTAAPAHIITWVSPLRSPSWSASTRESLTATSRPWRYSTLTLPRSFSCSRRSSSATSSLSAQTQRGALCTLHNNERDLFKLTVQIVKRLGLGLGTWDLGPGTWDLGPGIWDLGPRT